MAQQCDMQAMLHFVDMCLLLYIEFALDMYRKSIQT
jgi:hypothetical protein